ncbi:MAG: KH domain-containing protein [Thermoleophilaceae bacterium]
MDELLEFLARSLVDEPDAVTVTTAQEEEALVLELRVAADDAGQIIGRRGRTIGALRTVMRAVGASQDQRVLVDLVD